MADVNNTNRKRSISASESSDTIPTTNDDNPTAPAKVDIVEPAAKLACIDDISQKEEHNLEIATTDSTNHTTHDSNTPGESTDRGELEALREENMKLRLELEEITKICKCTPNVNINNEDDYDTPLITIKFHHESIAESYRSQFQAFLKTFKDFKHTTTDLEIHISKSDVDTLDDSIDSFRKGRKRKKSKSKSQDLFVLDTTPSLATKEHSDLKYVSKYMVQTLEDVEKVPEARGPSTCWNCEENHNLRDCPEPRDFEKIKTARNKMRSQQISKPRYHLDEEQKYSHLKPGKISEQLMEALGVRSGELPPYIYRMRTVGYPPGWMEEAKIQHSNLSLYDIEGKEDSNTKKSEFGEIDPNKVVEYPGFNTPMDDGMSDDYRYHNCPPFSERCSKEAMLTYLKQIAAKAKDNLETCDMDLDTTTEISVDTVMPPGVEEQEEEALRRSPTLTDLEKKKLELLAELDNGSNSNSVEVKMALEDVILEVVTNEGNNEKDEVKIDENLEVIEENNVAGDLTKDLNVTLENNHESAVDNVKLSVFGTPIIKSASPYSRLPHAEKFSKDISPVINFENLPNSTGKYEQMTNVLQKVRNTLKNLNEKC